MIITNSIYVACHLKYILKEYYSLSAIQFSSKIQVAISAENINVTSLFLHDTHPWKLLKMAYCSVIENTFAKPCCKKF